VSILPSLRSIPRKVVKESATGSTVSQKRRLSLTIEVTKVEFDTDSLEVRISGPNREESEHVRMGAHHTITLEVGRQFRLEKNCWDQIFLDRLEVATHPEREAEVMAVVMASTGIAHICLVTEYLTLTRAKIDVNIPKKRGVGSSHHHSKAVTKFYEAIYQALLRHADFTTIKCVLLASPGFVKDDFYQYLLAESIRREDRPFIENKHKFILCRASSGHRHALEEVFQDPTVMAQLADTKMAKEVDILSKFMRMMDTNPDQAQYGYLHVFMANEQGAVDSLLVTDELFRSSDIATRKQYVNLVEQVRENGGKVYIFSSLHVSGTQLQKVSGVAAILRFPMPELADINMVDDNLEGENSIYDTTLEENGKIHAAIEMSDEDMITQRIEEDVRDMGL
jgi:protein pelota